MRRIDRATVIGTVSAAALFVCTAFIGAQAPASPPQTTAPPQRRRSARRAPPAGRGGLPGTESGWATFQGQCYGCHRNESPDGTPTAWSIRQLTPERIFAVAGGPESWRRQRSATFRRQRVAEFMSGRPMGSIGAGEAEVDAEPVHGESADARSGERPVVERMGERPRQHALPARGCRAAHGRRRVRG